MIAEDRLIGWLCIIRLCFGDDYLMTLPKCVQDELVARGWFSIHEGEDFDGKRTATITDAGMAITDLHGADWGINTIPEEHEA